MEKLILKYKEYSEILKNYKYSLFVMDYDANTDCPKKGVNYSLKVQQFFIEKIIEIRTSKDFKDIVQKLYKEKDHLENIFRLQIEKEYKEINKLDKIPHHELKEHLENVDDCYFSWVEGRKTNDYSKYLKDLDKLVSYNKKYIKWQETDEIKGFNVLLDEMEDDFTEEMYDNFFDLIEEKIVPLVKKLINKPSIYNKKLDNLKFDIDLQKKLTNKITSIMNYTNDRGCIRETIHPFMSGGNNFDCRITTNYKEDMLFSSIYSIMHETGHALYELGIDENLVGTNLFGGSSCALHECQSRFYENYLGRNIQFVKYLHGLVKEIFPNEMEGISSSDLYNYVNQCKAQLTRIEADELTYPIHVLIRYKIEKMLFNSSITVYQIEETFNDLMMEYLGIKPKNMTEGCFQDIHWTKGFGYFPTYALGSAIGAQILYSMDKDVAISDSLIDGRFDFITNWLTKRISKYGMSKKNLELIKNATGEEFNPNYYIDYLYKKFDI